MKDKSYSLKIATWNVNSLRVRLPQVLDWIVLHQPHAIALQETKVEDKNFPTQAIEQLGYQTVFIGQKTYNGVALLSREPARDVTTTLPDFEDTQRRILAATVGQIRIINIYVPNGQSVDSDKYHYKLAWLNHLTAFIQQQMKQYPKLIVLGDFNIAPEDRDVHDPQRWKGHVMVSESERAALQKIFSSGLTDTFRAFHQEAEHYTWWDYRAAALRRNHGLRIDHVLTSAALMPACIACEIDKPARLSERPSDHAPVVAMYRPSEILNGL